MHERIVSNKHKINLTSELSYLQYNKKFCDITLSTNALSRDEVDSVSAGTSSAAGTSSSKVATSGTLHIIDCHRLILAAASDKLQSYIYTGNCTNRNIIDLSPAPPDALDAFVSFIYCGECYLSNEVVPELLKLAVKWEIQHLAKECINYIFRNLQLNKECIDVLVSLDEINYCDSFKRAINFVANSLTKLIESGLLQKMPSYLLKHILDEPAVKYNQEKAFKCIQQWALSHKVNSYDDILLRSLDFNHMSPEFLGQNVLPDPLFKSSQFYESALTSLTKYATLRLQPQNMKSKIVKKVEDTLVLVVADFHQVGLVKTHSSSCNTWEIQVATPEWVDAWTRVTGTNSIVYMAGAHITDPHTPAILDLKANECKILELPKLPNTALIEIMIPPYVYQFTDAGELLRFSLSSVSCAEHARRAAWEMLKNLPERPSVVCNIDNNIYMFNSKTHMYNINTNVYIELTRPPQRIGDSHDVGCVVIQRQPHIFFNDQVLIYVPDCDSWKRKTYSPISRESPYAVNAVLYKGKILLNSAEKVVTYNIEENYWEEDKDLDIQGIRAAHMMLSLSL